MLINVNNPVEVTTFLPTLFSTLQSAGLDSQVKIACCDTIGWANAKTVASRLISGGMEKYLGLFTSHMYTGDPNSAITGTKLPAWMTEGADLQSRWCTTWYSNGGLCEGLTWANKVATGILSANLSGYIYWQGLEVNQGQASSYLVYVPRFVYHHLLVSTANANLIFRPVPFSMARMQYPLAAFGPWLCGLDLSDREPSASALRGQSRASRSALSRTRTALSS